MVAPRSHVGCSTNPLYFWFLDSFLGNGCMEWVLLTQTRNVGSVSKLSPMGYLSVWQVRGTVRKLGNRRSSEGLRSFKPSNGTNLIPLLILDGDIEMNPGPRFQCRFSSPEQSSQRAIVLFPGVGVSVVVGVGVHKC